MARIQRMVQSMEPGADPQALTHRAEPQPQVGMLETLTQLRQGHDGNKLPRCHTNQLRYQHNDAVTQNIVQQMVAVVAPYRQLALRMVQRMQTPPPFEAMLTTVNPIIQQIKNRQVQQQTDPRNISNTRPDAVELESRDAADAERAKKTCPTMDPTPKTAPHGISPAGAAACK